jgi:hypothetical protein
LLQTLLPHLDLGDILFPNWRDQLIIASLSHGFDREAKIKLAAAMGALNRNGYRH